MFRIWYLFDETLRSRPHTRIARVRYRPANNGANKGHWEVLTMTHKQDFLPEGLTDQEVARILGCGVSTVRRMRYNGQLPTVRIGSRGVRIPRRAVEALLAGDGAQDDRRQRAGA